METNKRNSVFAGIFPSNEPAPQPVSSPQVPRPAVSEEQVAALNRKIELLEGNIVGRIEKKLAEQVLPPAPPPPSAPAPAIIEKITEIESRMKDFQEKFLLGAAKMRNIEESKISARSEIGELLKAVREQQKYSELDRQMHDQLEKAWLRVEEIEKRMMEVYSAAARKPAEHPAPGTSPAAITAAVLKAVDGRLDERLKSLEASLKLYAAKTEAASEAVKKPAEIAAEMLKAVDDRLEERLSPLEAVLKNAAARTLESTAVSHGIGGRVAELSAAVDARLAGFSSEIRQLHIEVFAGKERVEDMLAEVKKDLLSSVREVSADWSGVFFRQVDAAALDGRERIDALAKLVVARLDELGAQERNTALKIDALKNCVNLENGKMLSAVSSAQSGHEKALRTHIDGVAAQVVSENARQLEEIKEAYRLSASSASAIAAVVENISGIEASLGGVIAGLKAFTKALSPVSREAILGVSGAILRGSLESAEELAVVLERKTVLLARAKGEIEESLKNMGYRSGGGKK